MSYVNFAEITRKSDSINYRQKKEKTLVFGNAGDEKNFHPDGRKFIFLIDFPEVLSFL